MKNSAHWIRRQCKVLLIYNVCLVVCALFSHAYPVEHLQSNVGREGRYLGAFIINTLWAPLLLPWFSLLLLLKKDVFKVVTLICYSPILTCSFLTVFLKSLRHTSASDVSKITDISNILLLVVFVLCFFTELCLLFLFAKSFVFNMSSIRSLKEKKYKFHFLHKMLLFVHLDHQVILSLPRRHEVFKVHGFGNDCLYEVIYLINKFKITPDCICLLSKKVRRWDLGQTIFTVFICSITFAAIYLESYVPIFKWHSDYFFYKEYISPRIISENTQLLSLKLIPTLILPWVLLMIGSSMNYVNRMFIFSSSFVILVLMCSTLIKSGLITLKNYSGSTDKNFILNVSLFIQNMNMYIILPVVLLTLITSMILYALHIIASPYFKAKGYQFSFIEGGVFLASYGLQAVKKLPPREEMEVLPGYIDGSYHNITNMITDIYWNQDGRDQKEEQSEVVGTKKKDSPKNE